MGIYADTVYIRLIEVKRMQLICIVNVTARAPRPRVVESKNKLWILYFADWQRNIKTSSWLLLRLVKCINIYIK